MIIATRPQLFLYAGQDFKDGEAWPGAREARGVADAYAAVKALAGGHPNERVPMWNTVTKTMLLGSCELAFALLVVTVVVGVGSVVFRFRDELR